MNAAMMIATRLSLLCLPMAGAFLVAPNAHPRVSSIRMQASPNQDAARAAWLAKQEAPAWGAAASPAPPGAEAAAGATSEEEAKQAWLAQLDAPAWGAAASAMSQVASQASQVQTLTEDCASGVEQACDSLSLEEEAKLAWIQKLDAPSWGAVAAAVSAVGSEVTGVSEEAAKSAWLSKSAAGGAAGGGGKGISEESAKEAWLARLDVPTWGQAAAAISQVAADASSFAAREEACDEGDDVACQSLSNEDAVCMRMCMCIYVCAHVHMRLCTHAYALHAHVRRRGQAKPCEG